MKPEFTRRFARELAALPQRLQERTLQKITLLCSNPAHPSLRVKRLQGHEGLWEASVNMQYRLLFRRTGDETARFLRVGTHKIFDSLVDMEEWS